MNNQTKINTKNHPRFLELGNDYNDPIILMKGLERIEERIYKLQELMVAQGILMGMILIALVFL